MQVSPFGHPRLNEYVLLPAAFRSLSRPSSAPSAKSFPLCSFQLDQLSVNPNLARVVLRNCVLNCFRLPFFSFHIFCLLSQCNFYSVFKVHVPHHSRRSFLPRLCAVKICLYPNIFLLPIILAVLNCWWAQVDSNHRPHAYQACALTT